MNVAFIPVRGGSKSIPLKNIRFICGKPLVYWTVKAACECSRIDKVYVATDSKEIREVVERFAFDKVEVIGRSEESASDTASTEYAMLEFAVNREFDNIVLIQATSPMLQAKDLDAGFALFNQNDTDSVLSVVRQKRFLWKADEKGFVNPVNYDVYNRPRRQEFDGYLVENGAFYITSRKDLLASKNRISGRIKTLEMAEDTFYEIDEISDWVVVESLMKKNGMILQHEELCKKAANIKVFLTDSDGCLTDGGMYYSERGDEMKKFNTRDGVGIRILREKGIITGIVTGEDVEMVRRRAAKLRMQEVHCGVDNKLDVVRNICAKYKCSLENVAYVGDDINDVEVLQAVGLAFSVADGWQEVKDVADYVTVQKGGNGAIREIVDIFFNGRIMKIH
ncbi:MAG: acylneuraminate cytidylyltransferase [Lachnospiraceae bacterium]|nr:acylneuraminate cytidylyltransferase [Lachnospiraceae bacterium]